MAAEHQIAFVVGAALAGSFTGAFSKAGNAMGELQKRISTLSKNQSAVAAFGKLQERVNKTGGAFNVAQRKIIALDEQMRTAVIPSKQMEGQFSAARLEVGKLENKLQSQRNELRQLSNSLSTAGIDTKNLASEQARLAEQAEKLAQVQGRLADAQGRIDAAKQRLANAKGEIIASAGILMSLGKTTQAAMKFESAMADVKKVVNFDAGKEQEQIQQMGNELLELSRRIPMAYTGLAQIAASAGQAGIARQDIVKFTEDAAKMGVAFDISAEQAGDMMATWRTAFKMGSQQEVINLADTINLLGNTTAASSQDIADVVTRIGPLGEIGGVASEQMSALAASVVAAGSAPDVAATGIKNFMLALNAGTSATDAQIEAFAALRMDYKLVASDMQKDSEKVIISVLRQIGKLEKHKQAALITELMGKQSVGAIAPLLTNLDKLEENFRKINNPDLYNGSMEKEFQARSETTENSIQLLKNSFGSLSVIVGQYLLPPLNMLAKGLSWGIEGVIALANAFPNLTRGIILSGAALGAFKVGRTIKGITGAVLNLWSASREKTAILSEFSGKTSIWTKAKNVVMNLGTSCKNVRGAIVEVGKKGADAFKWAGRMSINGITSLGRGLANVGSSLVKDVIPAAGKFSVNMTKLAFSGVANGVKMFTSGLASVGKMLVTQVIPAVWSFSTALLANPVTWVVLGIAALVGVGYLLYKNWEKIKAGFSDLMARLGAGWDWVRDKFTTFKNWISGQWNAFKERFGFEGLDIWTPLVRAWDSARNLVANGWNWLKGLFFIDGNFNAFAPIGYAWEGVKNLVSQGWTTVKGWFSEKFSFAWDWLTSGWSSAQTTISQGWASLKGWFNEKLSFAWDWLASGWPAAQNVIFEGWESVKGWFGKGADFAAGVWDSLQSGWQTAQGLISSGWDAIKNSFVGDWASGAWNWAKNLVGMGDSEEAVDQAALAAQLSDITMLNKMSADFAARVAEMTAAWQPFKDSLGEGFENIFNLMAQTGGMIRTIVIPAVNELNSALSNAASSIQTVAAAGGMQVNISQAAAKQPKASGFWGGFAHAAGGIFTVPHMGIVAEEGDEAIIPLEKRSRGIPLWMAAGEAMGMSFGGNTTTNNVTSSSPQINITVYGGNEGNIAQRVAEEVRRAWRDMQEYSDRTALA